MPVRWRPSPDVPFLPAGGKTGAPVHPVETGGVSRGAAGIPALCNYALIRSLAARSFGKRMLFSK